MQEARRKVKSYSERRIKKETGYLNRMVNSLKVQRLSTVLVAGMRIVISTVQKSVVCTLSNWRISLKKNCLRQMYMNILLTCAHLEKDMKSFISGLKVRVYI